VTRPKISELVEEDITVLLNKNPPLGRVII
jgi:hypothetical protein